VSKLRVGDSKGPDKIIDHVVAFQEKVILILSLNHGVQMWKPYSEDCQCQNRKFQRIAGL
jgi:hypothetical protein